MVSSRKLPIPDRYPKGCMRRFSRNDAATSRLNVYSTSVCPSPTPPPSSRGRHSCPGLPALVHHPGRPVVFDISFICVALDEQVNLPTLSPMSGLDHCYLAGHDAITPGQHGAPQGDHFLRNPTRIHMSSTVVHSPSPNTPASTPHHHHVLDDKGSATSCFCGHSDCKCGPVATPRNVRSLESPAADPPPPCR